MVETGNPDSITDAGVGALALRSCIKGASLNVKVNASGLEDKTFTAEIITKAQVLERKAVEEEEAIIKTVESRIN